MKLPAIDWPEHRLLDSGEGAKLEQLGPYTIIREEHLAIHPRTLPPETWAAADAYYIKEGGWQLSPGTLESWNICFGPLTLQIRPAPGFKHIGLFPEQAPQWQWLLAHEIKRDANPPKLLNLFGHTGAATLAAALAGFAVTHVDSSRPAISQARHNQKLSELGSAPIHWIHEDAPKFVERELKRGNRYDAILLDPPAFGRGPKGQTWQIGHDLPGLLEEIRKLLSDRPRFIFLNLYAGEFSAATVKPLLEEGAIPNKTLHQGHFTLHAENGPDLEMAEWLCLA